MTTGFTTLPAHTRRTILLLSLATFSSMAVQRICDAMLPELSQVFSVSLSQAAQVVSVFSVVYGLSQLFYGPLGDHLGKFRVATFGTLICSVGCVLSVFAWSLDFLVLSRVLVALGAAAIIPLSLAWIGDAVAYEVRQETLARVGLGTTLGITGGQLIGGVLTDTLGWRWAFVCMALVFSVVGLLMLFDLKQQRASNAPAATRPELGPHPGFVRQALHIITGRWSRIVLLVALLEGAAGFGVLAIWAAHLHQALGLPLSAAGAVVALFGIGGMVYMALARRMIARLGEQGLARLGVGLLGLAALVVAYTPVWWPTLPACLLAGFGFFMFHNTMQANATQMAPTARGTAVSLFASGLFLGQSLGVLLAASLVAHIGSAAVIAWGGVLMFLLGAFFSQALRWRDRLHTA